MLLKLLLLSGSLLDAVSPSPFFPLLPPFIPRSVSADCLVPLLLNYALLFPPPEDLTAEALFLPVFYILGACCNLV